MSHFSSSSDSGCAPQLLQTCLYANGVKTNILCQSFTDRHFVLITQNCKVGTLIQAWAEDVPSGGYTFHTQTLLGRRDDPLLSGLVSFVAQQHLPAQYR